MRPIVISSMERQRVRRVSELTAVFRRLVDSQAANLASPLELPLLAALEFSADLQAQWTSFMAIPIHPEAPELELKSEFACIAGVLCAFLEGLSQIFEKIQDYTPGQQTIICATIEYCLTDIYANFQKRFGRLISALASCKGPAGPVVRLDRGAESKDLLVVVLSKTANFIMFCAKLNELYAELDESRELKSAYFLNFANEIATTANMVLATLWAVKVQVNREPVTPAEWTKKVGDRIAALNFPGHVRLRGLSLSEDPIHTMLKTKGAALLEPSMKAKVPFPTKEESVANLEEELASRSGPKSPADLRMIRLSYFVPVWATQIFEMGQEQDAELFERLKNAAQLLARQFSQQDYPLAYAGAMSLADSLDKITQEREKAAQAAADLMAQQLGAGESKKRKKSKKPKPQGSKKDDSLSSVEPIEAAPEAVPKAVPAPEIAPQQGYRPEELFLTGLGKSQKSPQKKIEALDQYCKENAQVFRGNPAAQVFFELARSAWLRASKASEADFAKQLVSLERLLSQGEYCEWLRPEIIELQKKLPSKQGDISQERLEAIPVDQSIQVSLPDSVAAILTALSEPDQIGTFPRKAYVVGGFVRDALRETKNDDIDIVALGYPEGFYKSDYFHEQLRGKLSEQLKCAAQEIKISLSPLGNLLIITVLAKRFEVWFSAVESMEKDAKLRDFSFNALYADEKGLVHAPVANSVVDAKERRCRAVNLSIFFNDPLRLLRLLDYQILRDYELTEELSINLDAELAKIRVMNEKGLVEHLGSEKEHFAVRFKKLLMMAIEKNSALKVLTILRSLGLEVLLLLMPEDCGKLYGHVPFTSAVSEMKKSGQTIFGSPKSSTQVPLGSVQARLS